METFLHGLLVFGVLVVTDLLWSWYIKSLASDKMIMASSASALIIVCGSYATINYVGNHIMIIPAALGAFTGTYLSKYINKKKEQ